MVTRDILRRLVGLCCLSTVLSVPQGAEFEFEEIEPTLGTYVVRKCCPIGNYYNTNSQNCAPAATGQDQFSQAVNKFLVRGNATNLLHTVTGRLTSCSETEECPETYLITSDRTNMLLPDGSLFEHFFSLTYDITQYCVDMVGVGPQSLSLSVAVCLHETRSLSKCCPEPLHFDSTINRCVPNVAGKEFRSALKAATFRGDKQELNYKFELQCLSSFPQKIPLNETYIDACNSICLRSTNKCYSVRKYCVDNVSDLVVEPSAFVCADNVTKKCCKDERFEKGLCSCAVI